MWFSLHLCLNCLHLVWRMDSSMLSNMYAHVTFEVVNPPPFYFLSTLCLLTIVAGFRHGQKVSCLQKSTTCTGTWTQWRDDKQEKESKAHGQVWIFFAFDNCMMFSFLFFFWFNTCGQVVTWDPFGLTAGSFFPWFCANQTRWLHSITHYCG